MDCWTIGVAFDVCDSEVELDNVTINENAAEGVRAIGRKNVWTISASTFKGNYRSGWILVGNWNHTKKALTLS